MAVFIIYEVQRDNTELGLLQQIDEQAFLYDSNGGLKQVCPTNRWKIFHIGSKTI